MGLQRALAWILKGGSIEVMTMERWARIGTLTACVALAFGCDEQTEVQRQTHDLQEAQKNVAQVTQELETQLEQAKADVVRLEQKVALARQGLTDDVLENQKELQAALHAQEEKVAAELGEAKREAQIHSRDTEAALRQIGQTATPPAEPVAPGEAVAPGQAPLIADPNLTAPSETPREDLVPVKGADPDPALAPEATPPPAPLQPSSPVADPTGAVPPPPPHLAPNARVAPAEPAPVEPAPVEPAPVEPAQD